MSDRLTKYINVSVSKKIGSYLYLESTTPLEPPCKKKRSLDIRIEIKENLIGVIRPTSSEAADYHTKLRTFLMEQLQDSNLLTNVRQIDQVQIEGE